MIESYNAHTGNYPVATSRYSCQYSTAAEFIPGIETVVSTLPKAPCAGGGNINDSWFYQADTTGANYKLIYLRPSMSDGSKALIPPAMRDPSGTRWSSSSAWGYWSPGGSGL